LDDGQSKADGLALPAYLEPQRRIINESTKPIGGLAAI
jgi:hypothetical protein